MAEIFNGKYLGCCQSLLSVSRKEIMNRIKQIPNEINKSLGNLHNLKEYLNLNYEFIYRFPYKEDLKDKWDDEHEEHEIVISVDADIVGIPHNDFVQTTIKGKTYNLPFCPASDRSEKLGIKKINHWKTDIRIYGEKYTTTNPNGYTLFECVTCGCIFALDRNEAIYIRKLLHHQGLTYESNLIKYKVSDELSEKAKSLQTFANTLDNEGLTYSYKEALSFIQHLEDEENRDISLAELEDILTDNQFCGV